MIGSWFGHKWFNHKFGSYWCFGFYAFVHEFGLLFYMIFFKLDIFSAFKELMKKKNCIVFRDRNFISKTDSHSSHKVCIYETLFKRGLGIDGCFVYFGVIMLLLFGTCFGSTVGKSVGKISYLEILIILLIKIIINF